MGFYAARGRNCWKERELSFPQRKTSNYILTNEVDFSARQKNFLSNQMAERSPFVAGLVKVC